MEATGLGDREVTRGELSKALELSRVKVGIWANFQRLKISGALSPSLLLPK